MLEIFVLPYFAISGVIGWVIFKPFFPADESESLLPGNVTITDLLAIPLPVSVLFAFARWIMPESILSLHVQAIVVGIALVFAVCTLTTGLILVPKTFQVTFLKRMTVVGIIAPFGIIVTLGWIGILIWAGSYSISYLAPSSIAIAVATAGLRALGLWVCQPEPKMLEKAATPPI